MCDRNDFPLHASLELTQHTDEVWYVQFSHDGSKLATASSDHSVIIYDTSTFTVIHKLSEHEEPVAYAAWSPDDSKIVTCSQDRKARVWSVEVRRENFTLPFRLLDYSTHASRFPRLDAVF
jgi:WD repeat-containing protein 26